MFAIETNSALPPFIFKFLVCYQFPLNRRLTSEDQKIETSKPQQMRKIYINLLFAISNFNNAVNLHFFPDYNVNKLQLQRVHIYTASK